MWSDFDDDDFIIIFSNGAYLYEGLVKNAPEEFKHDSYDWYELGNSELADYLLIDCLSIKF